MKPVLWFVQTNLGNAATPEAIRAACERNGLLFRGITRRPFSDDLPDLDYAGPVMAYGATRFIKSLVDSARWTPGAFFDETTFTVASCLRRWGAWMVNGDSAIVRLDAVASLPHGAGDHVFVRPNGDLKDFAGEVMTFRALCDWAAVVSSGDLAFDGSLLVAVAGPKPIKSEWRVFAVEGAGVVAATRYRLDGRLAQLAGAPPEVVAFVETRLQEWMPSPALALDVAETDDGLRILELSDFHSAGHYAADVEAIVVAASRVAARHWQSRG